MCILLVLTNVTFFILMYFRIHAITFQAQSYSPNVEIHIFLLENLLTQLYEEIDMKNLLVQNKQNALSLFMYVQIKTFFSKLVRPFRA